jgi:hypothetical protein
MKTPYLPYLLSGALALALVLGFYFPWQNEFSQDTENGTGVKTLYAPVKKSASILFVGDIMMTRGVESSVNKNFAGDYSKIFENASYLADADITFGNLEGAVSDLGHNVGSKFSFRMNPLVIRRSSLRGLILSHLPITTSVIGLSSRLMTLEHDLLKLVCSTLAPVILRHSRKLQR